MKNIINLKQNNIFQQYFPCCRIGCTRSIDPRSTFVGQPGNRWSPGNRIVLQPRRPRRHGKSPQKHQGNPDQPLVDVQILRRWRFVGKLV